MDWTDWHKKYGTSLVLLARLRIVREQIQAFLDECAAGPIRIVSICAGDGRDVIEALADHPRRRDVTAWLVDTDEPSLERGREAAIAAGLASQLRFVCADATLAATYNDIAPADLVIVSGVLGHMGNEGNLRFLENLPMLCKSGASVIWNRHLVTNGGAEDVVNIREKLRLLDFEEAHYSATSRNGFAVGRSRFRGLAVPLDAGRKIFEFIGLDRLSQEQDWDGRHVVWGSHERSRESDRSDEARIFGGLGRSGVGQSLPSCFERLAAQHPGQTAIGSGGWQPGYAELNSAANRLAYAVLARGVARGDRIALLMQHDGPLIAAMLAALKAGGLVVVLNATDPATRLEKVLNDAEPSLILTDSQHKGPAAQIARGGCNVVSVEEYLAGDPVPNPGVQISPGETAFLVYTSGSTGPPKGVMQSHRNILHKVFRVSRALELSAADRILLSASLSGGQGVNTTWCALAAGTTLCPFPIMTKGITGLADWMTGHGVTVYVSSASTFRHFARTLGDAARIDSTRLVWLASEPATPEDFISFRKHFGEDAVLFHTLASSETGVIMQLRLGSKDPVPHARLPVGHPVEDMEVLLLDEEGREVPRGATGEIAVKSRYLFTGYWRDDALTAQRLSGDGGPDGVKTFRTGDLARLDAGGQFVFMGRADSRVNIHGYRVELSEIEAALLREPAVERAVVCLRAWPSSEERLAAYITLRPGHVTTGDALRQALRGTLPGHMIPAAFVFLDAFPLTPHGKIDREVLARITPAIPSQAGDEPATETEKLIAGIWSEVFERKQIARQDDFFELGGDSLTALVVAAKIHAILRVRLEMRVFAELPTLSALASAVDEFRATTPAAPIVPLAHVSREEPLPLSFHQERTWKFSQTPEESVKYTAAGRISIVGPLDAATLRESMSYLACRHEALRTTYSTFEGNPVQVINPPQPEPLPLIDLAGTDDPEERAEEIFREETRRPFDLARGPLMRFTLIRLRENEHRLLRVGHHINSDAWSYDLYLRELGLVYEAKLRGEPPPLPEFEPLQYQYADYAAWQRRVMGPGTPAYEDAVSWWEKQLAAQPPPLEPAFRRPVALQNVDPAEGVCRSDLDPAVLRRLSRIAHEQHATFFLVRLAAFVALLAGETGEPDVILGTYVTNRNRLETQKMFGFFSNPALLRFRCDTRLTFREWIALVGVTTSDFQARSEIPYEQLCEELRKRGVVPPELRVIFTVSDDPGTLSFGGLELTKMRPRRLAFMPWGFTFLFYTRDNRDICSAAFDANLYDPAGVLGFVNRTIRFLDAASREPDSKLARLLAESAAAATTMEEPHGLERMAPPV